MRFRFGLSADLYHDIYTLYRLMTTLLRDFIFNSNMTRSWTVSYIKTINYLTHYSLCKKIKRRHNRNYSFSAIFYD